ncbi:hypothetical protein HDU88_007279 [Geranomyces variabilis]|nr:hypothetical protein HDU88_007279 [Geranomyces variabilis]
MSRYQAGNVEGFFNTEDVARLNAISSNAGFTNAPKDMAVAIRVCNRDQTDTTGIIVSSTTWLDIPEMQGRVCPVRAGPSDFQRKTRTGRQTSPTTGFRPIRLRRQEAMFPLTFGIIKFDNGGVGLNASKFDENKVWGPVEEKRIPVTSRFL